MKSEILSAVETVLDRGQFILGEEVRRFEEETAAYLGSPMPSPSAMGQMHWLWP